MKKINFGILILIISLIFLTFNTNLISFNISRDNKQSNETYDKPRSAQENAIWSRVWGGSNSEGHAIWGDGTYIYTCGSSDFVTGNTDLVLVKWDSSGNELWNRTWGGPRMDNANAIWGDGTYIYTCGTTDNTEYATGKFDLVLVKWDSSGNELWNRTWGGPELDTGTGVWGDGTYIYTCGETFSFGAGSFDLVLVKWDSNGNLIWYRTWGGPSSDSGSAIWGDGTYIYTCGSTGSFGAGSADFVLVAWDRFGNMVLWNRTWGGTEMDRGASIWGDGTFIYTCGTTMSFGEGGFDLALVKWNKLGDTIWYRTWGGHSLELGSGIWGDGTFIYSCGFVDSPASGCLIKWDTAGNQVWNTTFESASFRAVWGDGTYIYTCGYNFISEILLVKWESSEHLEIILLSPAEGLVYESGIHISIHLDKELVILESFKYHWDNNDDTDWTEPYTTSLPIGDGLHTLYVSATTTVPYISDSKSFTFITDDTDPIVNIDSPNTNDIFASAPAFDLDIDEPHIAQRWYTLNDGLNYYFYNDAGTIDDSAWKALPEGDVIIEFCVSDTLGHLTEKNVVVRKDTQAGQREFNEMIRNAITGVLISAGVGGAIGLGYWLIKRSIKKRDEKLKTEKKS